MTHPNKEAQDLFDAYNEAKKDYNKSAEDVAKAIIKLEKTTTDNVESFFEIVRKREDLKKDSQEKYNKMMDLYDQLYALAVAEKNPELVDS